MPPDISAGPLALVGTPPGTAAAGKPAAPPVPGTGSAALFASFLTQSSPLPPPAKAAIGLLPADGRMSLKLGKTMDTWPKFSLPIKGKPRTAASELLSPTLLAPNAPAPAPLALNAPAHITGADAVPQDAPSRTDGVSGTVLLSAAPAPVHFYPVQLGSVSMVPVSMVPASMVPASTTAAQVPTAQVPMAPSALPPAQAPAMMAVSALPTPALPTPALPAPAIASPVLTPSASPLPQATVLAAAPTRPSAAGVKPSAPLSPAPDAGPAVFDLPRTWTFSVPSPAPQTTAQAASQTAGAAAPPASEPASEPASDAANIAAVRPSLAVPTRLAPAGRTATMPQNASAIQPEEAAVLPKEAAMPQAAILLPAAPPAAFAALTTAGAASVLAGGVPVQPAIAGPGVPAPAKLPAKSAPAALKPAGKNADTYTRMLSGGTAGVTAKTAELPAALRPSPEKQDAALDMAEPAKMLDAKGPEDAAATLQLSVSVPEMRAAGTTVKPLSPADHAALTRQVADGVGALALPAKPGASQQMKLQLHPQDWGSLQVSVTVAAGPEAGSAKTVTAHIVAETPQVKAALQSQSGTLHQALRASGLNLTHLTVSVKPPTETIKPASPSASAGFTPGQGQSSGGDSQTQANAQPGPLAGTTTFGGTASGGGSHDTRQGQAPAFAAAAAPDLEPEENTIERLPMRPISGRIDTHA